MAEFNKNYITFGKIVTFLYTMDTHFDNKNQWRMEFIDFLAEIFEIDDVVKDEHYDSVMKK